MEAQRVMSLQHRHRTLSRHQMEDILFKPHEAHEIDLESAHFERYPIGHMPRCKLHSGGTVETLERSVRTR